MQTWIGGAWTGKCGVLGVLTERLDELRTQDARCRTSVQRWLGACCTAGVESGSRRDDEAAASRTGSLRGLRAEKVVSWASVAMNVVTPRVASRTTTRGKSCAAAGQEGNGRAYGKRGAFG